MDDLVAVNSYHSRVEAELAKGVLEASGIAAIVSADDAGGMEPFPVSYVYGVQLKVRPEDLEKAKKILQTGKKEKVCSRGHKYQGSGPCPVCWPGYRGK